MKWTKAKENIAKNEIHNLIAAAKGGDPNAEKIMLTFVTNDPKIVYCYNLPELIGIEDEFFQSITYCNLYTQIPQE